MRNPYLDSNVLGKRFSVNQKQWHLVLGVEPKVVSRVLLAFLQINCLNAKIRIRFGQCDVWDKRAGDRCVVKSYFHLGTPDQLRRRERYRPDSLPEGVRIGRQSEVKFAR